MWRRSSRLMLLLAAATLVVAAVGCGAYDSGGLTSSPTASPTSSPTTSPTSGPTATPTSRETITVLVFFLHDEKLASAERRVPRTQAVARAAMSALCEGVNEFERAAGLSSSVPLGTAVRGIALREGTATVDLSQQFASGGGTLSMTSRVAQVVYTLTQFPTITAVEFELEGKPLDVLGGEGLLLETPQRRSDWESFEPPIFVERPGVGAYLASPFEIEGRATIFEATVQIEVLDKSNEILVRTYTTATRGAPERGSFRKRLTFTTSASAGFVVAYEQSLKDGSRLDEVRIPVRFAD